MKNERQRKILEIIASEKISTQGELIARLRLQGFAVTQATVSRDIRQLRIVRQAGGDGLMYYVSPAERSVDVETRLRTIFRECVVSAARAQNIVVLKTLPGLAPAACSAVDKMKIRALVGTIAGDDTAFMAMTDDDAAEDFCRWVSENI